MKHNKKIIVANWKMDPQSSKEAKKMFAVTRNTAKKLSRVETVICPPSVYIESLARNTSGHRVVLGAQDLYPAEGGAHTGEISPLMLRSFGLNYVILGHSERRTAGESNETVNQKVKSAHKHGFKVIVCVGENERDDDGDYLSFVREELRESLIGVSRKNMDNVIIAYEPLWAIGARAKKSDTPEGLFEMVIFIRKVLSEIYGKKIAMKTPVLYGGSVNDKNAEAFLRDGGILGLLVGRASRDMKKFPAILEIAQRL